jgi:septal ring factor EnvC (AmiA/AmiB activator)
MGANSLGVAYLRPKAVYAQAATSADLNALEKELKSAQQKANKLKSQEQQTARTTRSLKRKLIYAADRIQNFEEDLSLLETSLKENKARESQLHTALDARKQQTGKVLTALQRLSWRPTETIMAQPGSPADTLRSALLLKSALPELQQSAHKLGAELKNLHTLRAVITSQRDRIDHIRKNLRTEHSQLASLLRAQTSQLASTKAERQALENKSQQLAKDAQSLRELMEKLAREKAQRLAEERKKKAALAAAEKERAAQAKQQKLLELAKIAGQKPPIPKPHASVASSPAALPGLRDDELTDGHSQPIRSMKGKLPLPARGKIIVNYGQVTDNGTHAKGLYISTRNNAQVITPYDGEVRYADTFRSFGLLLIIEHDGGYHTLLAGLDRLDAAVGQKLMAGEPVGVMGSQNPKLYVELRQNGQPINPKPWLLARRS